MTEQLIFDLPQREALDRDAFLVTDSNREAVQVIDDFSAWSNPIQWIYGPSGSGKSHLAAVMAVHGTACYILAFDDISAALAPLVAGRQTCEIIILDCLDEAAATQEEALFHLFNHCLNGGAKLLLLSENPPAAINVGLPDLASRMKAVPAIALRTPDDDLVRGLMAKLFADRQVNVDARVLDYLVPRVERAYGALADLIDRIDRQAMAQKRRITVPLIAEIMERHIGDT